jgi:hypothetical protein
VRKRQDREKGWVKERLGLRTAGKGKEEEHWDDCCHTLFQTKPAPMLPHTDAENASIDKV